MSQRITLPFPPPLSACFNNVAGRGRVPSERYKVWTKQAIVESAIQRPRKFTGEVSVWIGVVAPDRRARDCDNLLKPIMDFLKKSGVIVDDSNKFVRRVSIEWLSSGSPVTVLINDFEGGAE